MVEESKAKCSVVRRGHQKAHGLSRDVELAFVRGHWTARLRTTLREVRKTIKMAMINIEAECRAPKLAEFPTIRCRSPKAQVDMGFHSASIRRYPVFP